MFCRNCGKELIGTPELCMNCGARPLAGNSYCSACGAATNPLAEICIKCGSRIRGRARSSPKNKMISVLLAIFLSYWTWLYTYRKDAWKFWIGTGIVLIQIILFFIMTWMTVGSIDLSGLIRQLSLLGLLTPLWILVPLWIWAVVDAARKNEEWYHSFPLARTLTI